MPTAYLTLATDSFVFLTLPEASLFFYRRTFQVLPKLVQTGQECKALSLTSVTVSMILP